MSPEEKAEIRRAEKEAMDEILAIKRAFSAELNALKTDAEWFAYMERSAEECRALGLNVV
jgi:hypothetical protein